MSTGYSLKKVFVEGNFIFSVDLILLYWDKLSSCKIKKKEKKTILKSITNLFEAVHVVSAELR